MTPAIEKIEIELPNKLVSEARSFVADGWHSDLNALVAEALRRYLDSHSPNFHEAFIRADVEWGLHGRD